MATALYLEDAYKTSCETEVIKVEGNKVFVKKQFLSSWWRAGM